MINKLTFAVAVLLIFAGSYRSFAQNTVVTYQGSVADNGTNFSGAGQFKFALVTSTNANHPAMAAANAPSGGYITGYSVTSGGNGYTAPPLVTIVGGGGSGAAATANLSGGVVTSLSVGNPGNGGYTNRPTVLIALPPSNISYTTYWSNDGTSINGGEPDAPVNINVKNGFFTALLGDTTVANMTAISAALFNRSGLQLRIWFNDGLNGSAALDPAQDLTPAPYALAATELLGGVSVQGGNTNGAPNIIGGASVNYVSGGAIGATISGGGALNLYGEILTNSVTGSFGTVGGGAGNSARAQYATIAGGEGNFVFSQVATVGGGGQNVASNSFATIGGGQGNLASGYMSVIAGGEKCTASGDNTVVGGGYYNVASGNSSAVLGGVGNVASGDLSFAAGYGAKAYHNGAFVWADDQQATFASTASNQFLIRAQGGVGINNASPQAPLHVTGGGDASMGGGGNIISGSVAGQNLVIDNNEIISRNNGGVADLILNFGSGNVGIGRSPAANKLELAGDASKATAGGWLANSDARIKTDVETVTGALEKLARVRLVRFRYTDTYRATHPGVGDREYLNVVAQEFQQVFPADVKPSGEKLANGDQILQVDTYPLTIYSAAAVQELNQKLERERMENADLRQRIGVLEKAILNRKSN